MRDHTWFFSDADAQLLTTALAYLETVLGEGAFSGSKMPERAHVDNILRKARHMRATLDAEWIPGRGAPLAAWGREWAAIGIAVQLAISMGWEKGRTPSPELSVLALQIDSVLLSLAQERNWTPEQA